jgi:hypothetical protein
VHVKAHLSAFTFKGKRSEARSAWDPHGQILGLHHKNLQRNKKIASDGEEMNLGSQLLCTAAAQQKSTVKQNCVLSCEKKVSHGLNYTDRQHVVNSIPVWLNTVPD